MLKRLLLAAALAAGFASPALAQAVPQVIATCGVGVSLPIGPGGRLYQDQTGILCTTAGSGGGGGGGGGATGSVTAPGTSGSVAQAVQGITGGVPQNTFSGQYNSTLPTFANAQVGYVALDSNGRQILSPSSSVSVSGGTVTSNIGTTNGLALDTTLSGVATSNSAISTATGTTADAATASGANSTIIGALRAIRDRLLATLTVTVSSSALPTGAATQATLATINTNTPAIGTQTKAASRSTTPASDLSNIEPAGTAISGTAMPSGGTGLTGWLSAIYQSLTAQSTYGNDAIGGSTIAANTAAAGPGHFAGTGSSSYSWFTASLTPSQLGTLYVFYSFDGTSYQQGASVSMTSIGQNYSLSVRIVAPYYRIQITNGNTATTSQTFGQWSFSKS